MKINEYHVDFRETFKDSSRWLFSYWIKADERSWLEISIWWFLISIILVQTISVFILLQMRIEPGDETLPSNHQVYQKH